MTTSLDANVRKLSSETARRRRAVVVSRRRTVRKALALALAESGFEVLSLESAKSMPWLTDARASADRGETVFVDGEVGRALAVVDVLRAQGLDCTVRIVAGTNLDGEDEDDDRIVA